MNILGIESSSKHCSVAINVGKDIYESSSAVNNDSATSLPVMTEKIMNKLSLTFKELDGIAVSMGPGSFTGLRIGLIFISIWNIIIHKKKGWNINSTLFVK